MIDWYSSYLFIRERQRELISQAEARRRLEAARSAERAEGAGLRPAGSNGASSIRHRIGEVLISLGQMLL